MILMAEDERKTGAGFHPDFGVDHPAAARSLAAGLAARFSQVGAFMYLYGQVCVCCGSVSLLRSRSFSFFLLLSSLLFRLRMRVPPLDLFRYCLLAGEAALPSQGLLRRVAK